MTLDEILRDIHILEMDLQNYERKYGVLSETFFESYSQGEEPEDDAWVMDWSAWAGTYEIWLRRRVQYRNAIAFTAPGLGFNAPNLPFLIKEIQDRRQEETQNCV